MYTILVSECQNQWLRWTYSEYLSSVETTALGLVALGLEPGDAVAIMGFNAPEWFFSDLGEEEACLTVQQESLYVKPF